MSIPGQQTINVGLPNNPANSDSLYQAFSTINNNFATLFQSSSPITTISPGNGIAISNTTTAYQITNTGVTSLIAGQNVTITTLGGSPGSNGALVISSTGTGGNGGGTVNSVGITSNTISVTNSPITTSGNIAIELPNISGVAGSYYNANLTVDGTGRVTSVSNGSSSGTVTSVSVSGGAGMAVSGSPITSSGTITVTNTGVTSIVAGTGIAVNQANGAVTITNTGGGNGGGGGTVTRVGVISNSLSISGSPVVSSGNIEIELPANITANVLTSNTAELSFINTRHVYVGTSNAQPLTLVTATGNSSVAPILSQKSRGNLATPTQALVNDSLLNILSRAYTSFNTYQTAGGFNVVLTGLAPNSSSTVSSRAVMSATSNANIYYSLSVDETGNTFIPGKIQMQQTSNIAQIPGLFMSRSRGADYSSPVAVQVGDSIGRIMSFGYSGNGTTSVSGSTGYTFAGSADWTVTALPGSSGASLPTDFTIRTVSTANLTLSSVFSSTGNLTIPGTFIGNGLSVTGNLSVGNITANNVTANTLTGTLTTAAQPNVTSVGTLTTLAVTGNISGANITVGNVTGTLLTPAQTNITSVGTLGNLTVTGNVTAARFIGNGSSLTGVTADTATTAGTVTTSAQPNITSVGALSSLSVTGTMNSGNVTTTFISGTLTTAAQANITSVGTLTSLRVSGNANVGGFETTLSATANTTATLQATIPIIINGVTYKIMLTQ